jgi:hypothetical protein
MQVNARAIVKAISFLKVFMSRFVCFQIYESHSPADGDESAAMKRYHCGWIKAFCGRELWVEFYR